MSVFLLLVGSGASCALCSSRSLSSSFRGRQEKSTKYGRPVQAQAALADECSHTQLFIWNLSQLLFRPNAEVFFFVGPFPSAEGLGFRGEINTIKIECGFQLS